MIDENMGERVEAYLAAHPPEHQARKLLDDRFGLGKEFAHRKIAQDVVVSRIYECAIAVIADLLRR